MNYQECYFSRRKTCFEVPKKNSDKVVRTLGRVQTLIFMVKSGAGRKLGFMDPQNIARSSSQAYVTPRNSFQGALTMLRGYLKQQNPKKSGALLGHLICVWKKNHVFGCLTSTGTSTSTSSFNFNFNSDGWDGMRWSYRSQCALQKCVWHTLLNSS
jgi:hypothetical protein